MGHTVKYIGSELAKILNLLDQPALFSFTEEETESLRQETESLSHKLLAIKGSFLTVGLLGGTGVGKSTLMNALSGSEICSTSHRRPHTDNVLVYRHSEAAALPSLHLEKVPWKEITHQAEAMKQVLLCDLPDFDSLMGEHREQVLGFIEHLDVLVWVTSPEKYADRRFYEFLQMVPKAKKNFYFVLNKTDLFFEGETLEDGYEQMAQAAGIFRKHVRQNINAEPVFFTVSAREASPSHRLSPWNQLPAFRQELFQQRDVKQVTAIKAANLDVEVQQILSVFEREVRKLERSAEVLEDSVRELESDRSKWIEGGSKTIDIWLDRYVRPHILYHHSDYSALVGPGYALAHLFTEWRKPFQKERIEPEIHPPSLPPEEIALSFQRRLEWLEDRLHHRVLHQNLPASLKNGLKEILEAPKRFQRLKEDLVQAVALAIEKPTSPSFRIFFKAFQFLAYLVLLLLFLFAIGGEAAWRDLMDDPGGGNLVGLILAAVNTLFSMKGLAALGSYALLNLFCGFFFYGRYKRMTRRAAQKTIQLLKQTLEKVWEEELDMIVQDLSLFKAEVSSLISTVHDLQKPIKTC
jgi:GTP-binding protein EngB required for normal cell division